MLNLPNLRAVIGVACLVTLMVILPYYYHLQNHRLQHLSDLAQSLIYQRQQAIPSTNAMPGTVLNKEIPGTVLNNAIPSTVLNKANCESLSSGAKPTIDFWRCLISQIAQTEGTNILCSTLYTSFTQETFFPQDYLKHLNHLNELMKLETKKVEGHSAVFWQSGMLFYDLGRPGMVRRVCQVGFNCGHSALSWLAANPHSHLISFDLGWHAYTRPAGEYIDQTFPGRHTLILGDSKKTLPKYIAEHPSTACDIIMVDGGHAYQEAHTDLVNMRNLSHTGSLLVMDDMGHILPYNRGTHEAWNQEYLSTNVDSIFHCANSAKVKAKGRGIMLGRYVNV